MCAVRPAQTRQLSGPDATRQAQLSWGVPAFSYWIMLVFGVGAGAVLFKRFFRVPTCVQMKWSSECESWLNLSFRDEASLAA